MKSRSRAKFKGRREAGRFLALPGVILDSAAYLSLSAHAVKLLLDLGAQYRGSNNGDLSAAWSPMHLRGWKSRDTLGKALKELLESGLIEMTRQGGLHKCSLYALTWQPIDNCGNKLEVSPTRVASNLWRHENRNASPPTVSIRHAGRVNSAQAA